MPTEYITGSQPIWQLFDNAAQVAYNGFLDTRSAANNSIPKLIYRDPAGLNPYPYPTRLTDLGRTPDQIYWANDEPYELRFLDQNYQLIPPVITPYIPNGSGGGGPPVTVTIDLFNHLLNPQFAFPLPIPAPLPATQFEFCRGSWFFHKSNTAATDSLSIVPFILGQTDVPGQPKYYLEYLCTNVGAGGETFKDFYVPLCNVVGFNDAEISIAMWLNSPSNSAVQVIFRQFFGTGGAPSPTVDTAAGSINASTAWAQDTLTVTVPSIAGKNLGTNGDDRLYIIFRLPLNQLSNIKFACAQFVNGSEIPPFYHQTDDYVKGQIQAREIPFISPDGSQEGYAILATGNTYGLGLPLPANLPEFYSSLNIVIPLPESAPIIPFDPRNLLPQITQGVEVINVTLTPPRVTSRILIQYQIPCIYRGNFATPDIAIVLFRSAPSVVCLSTTMASLDTDGSGQNTDPNAENLFFIDAPNTVSPVTYEVRIGYISPPLPSTPNVYINGDSVGQQLWGGTSLIQLSARVISL